MCACADGEGEEEGMDDNEDGLLSLGGPPPPPKGFNGLPLGPGLELAENAAPPMLFSLLPTPVGLPTSSK